VSGYDLSGDVTAIDTIAGGPDPRECTAINKSAMERIGGRKSGTLACTSWFDSAAGAAHDQLSNLPTTDQLVSAKITTTLGAPSVDVLAKQVNYDGTRSDDGDLTFEVEALSSAGYPLEWGRQLTAGKRTDSAAANGTGVDFAASSAFGISAYLHVFAFTGTSVTVKLQESSDNAVGDPYADVVGGGFTAATAITFQRIQTATNLTVERWLRVVTTGTFSNAVFAVSVCRYLTAVT
jgi:hypothetical protein